MDFAALEKNLIGVISEQQIKLGYRSEKVRLYYPLTSLNQILKTEDTFMQMLDHLEEFGQYTKKTLGKVEISSDGERFCLAVPPRGSDYIHAVAERNMFLHEFIQTIRRHGVTPKEVKEVFLKYSDKVHAEKIKDADFDYLLYFEDGEPDDYRYCLSDEAGHLTYHRFTKEDYEALFENDFQ